MGSFLVSHLVVLALDATLIDRDHNLGSNTCTGQTTLYRLVHHHVATFHRLTEAAGADQPQFAIDEVDVFLE